MITCISQLLSQETLQPPHERHKNYYPHFIKELLLYLSRKNPNQNNKKGETNQSCIGLLYMHFLLYVCICHFQTHIILLKMETT